ncbi:hypothetical protein OAK38_02980 [Verrucomicrobia bacterium]|nr:hypothetical protein [Verrucomicrobiota bacterium]
MPSPKIILGISAFYHDSAAFLLIDSEIVAASQEGRFSRIKHGNSDTEKNQIQKNDKEEEFQVKQGANKSLLIESNMLSEDNKKLWIMPIMLCLILFGA